MRGNLIAGGSIPGLARAAFTLQRPDGRSIPVLIAVPHAGRAYPPELTADMRDARTTALKLEDRFVDAVARQAAALCSASLLIAHAPRAMIDLNRDPGDLDLTMFTASEDEKAAMRRGMPRGGAHRSRSTRGLGLFPRRLSGVGEIWRSAMRVEDASRRIAAVHAPYHEALAATLGEIAQGWGEALLIDLHSMPDLPPRIGGQPPATHVIGDRFGGSCRRDLVEVALSALEGAGAESAYNRPYAGGYSLDRHGRPRQGVHAIQLEIARSLYLDGPGQGPGEGVATQARIIADTVGAVAAHMARDGLGWAQAAE